MPLARKARAPGAEVAHTGAVVGRPRGAGFLLQMELALPAPQGLAPSTKLGTPVGVFKTNLGLEGV